MERPRPNIDTVREILHEENQRPPEEPPPEPQEDDSNATEREDEAES
jgi:hypothetical protein